MCERALVILFGAVASWVLFWPFEADGCGGSVAQQFVALLCLCFWRVLGVF